MRSARIILLALVFSGSLQAQVRTFCQPDGSFVAAEGIAPKAAAARLLDYYNESGPSISAYPSNPNVMRALQSGLMLLGFSPGDIDGRYRDSLRVALLSLQSHFGLERTGMLDFQTTAILIRQLKDAPDVVTGEDCVIPVGAMSRPNIVIDQPQCNRGFVLRQSECVALAVPDNASLSFTGHDWLCKRGFVRSENTCQPVLVPENASLNLAGTGWVCRRGFLKNGEHCERIAVPENGALNLAGDGWICRQGFVSNGNACSAVVVPENGILNLTGTGWTCRQGFYAEGDHCSDRTGRLSIASSAQVHPLK